MITPPEIGGARPRVRTYSVPFHRVWQAALEAARNSPGWTVLHTEPASGTLSAETRTRWLKRVGDVRIRVTLDHHGLTRVDVTAIPRSRWTDFGLGARRAARYLRRLDRVLDRG